MNATIAVRTVIIGSLVGYGTFGGMVMASPLGITAPVVPDATLAQMVGKGVIGGQIVYFGVAMQTNWTAPGSTTPLQGNLNVAFNSSNNVFVPTITYSVTNPSLPKASTNPSASMDGSGLQNIQGVTQAIQIAGQGNGIQNAMSLNVVKGRPSTQFVGQSLQPGTTIQQGAVTMAVHADQLSMAIHNGVNTVQQGIGSNGVYQMAQVASNDNKIQSTMQMTLGVNPTAANSAQLQQLASMLKNNLPTNLP